MEIIQLDSDDDTSDQQSKNTQSFRKIIATCINFKCNSGVNMKTAPSFACAFYGVNSAKKKKRFICEKCFDAAIEHQEMLANALFRKEPLLNCEFPDHTMEVEISDSDESDENGKNESTTDDYIPEDVIISIGEKMDDALSNIFKKHDIEYQVKEAHKILKSQWDNIDSSNTSLDRDIKSMIAKMDSIRNKLYDEFKPDIKHLAELHIDDGSSENSGQQHSLVATKKVTQIRSPPVVKVQDNQVEVMSVEQKDKCGMEYGLPPHGALIRCAAEVDNLVLVMKHPLIPWRRAKVLTILSRTPMTYRVKYMLKRYNNQTKTVFGKQLAIYEQCPIIIPVATRVVALFSDIKTSNYYSGVIAEPPKATNKYRYLVFFDDGYAQYVVHKFIYVVSESSLRVWEDIPIESRDFVKKYLETYPERPMVKLQQGQVVKTEWNGKWWIARVIQVDASLVQMHFDADGRTEWIYRGSARLGPLFLELLKANARQQGHHASINTPSRHRLTGTLNKNNLPYVEYTSASIEQEIQTTDRAGETSEIPVTSPTNTSSTIPTDNVATSANLIVSITTTTPSVTTVNTTTTVTTMTTVTSTPTITATAPTQVRAVAKKSTAKRPSTSSVNETPNYVTNAESKPSHSIVYYQTQNKIQTRKFIAHKCDNDCIKGISFTPDDLKGYSPLSIPLLCGWNRQLCKYPKGKKVTLYQAPCGVRLRNMEEVHRYLRITNCTMSVDLFDFDCWVHCLAEFVLDKCFVNIKDLSYGVENVPIPCVNEIDHALPDTIRYSTVREPTEGVRLNLDPEFLCCCDCEDDCQDKSKCQCWQLTIQGATFGGRVPNHAVGYVYKRLPEPVTTGIYECNSRCKCSIKTCLNRVVQHPLSLKLQVFKTAPRGWGIRCLNDIPVGSFICIYAGRLLTEQGANEGGKNYGDEYLAELDYVEVVEGIKEGFEAEALESNDNPVDAHLSREKKFTEDERNIARKKTTNDSDEEFNIQQYNSEYIRLNTESDESMKKRLRKRKKSEDIGGPDLIEDRSEDGDSIRVEKDSNDKGSGDQDGSDEDDKDEKDEKSNGRREPSRFEPTVEPSQVEQFNFKSVRDFFGEDEAVYIMDAKTTGNIGRYLNHSCDPNVFVQNVFVDTHDVRFPWVAFFALNFIRAGQELTWNYSYDVGSIPGKVIICKCGASNCRGRLL